MYTVLLADADIDNIRNFKTYIKKSFSNMRVVGTVSSEADTIIDTVRELTPRLIIADIRFFGPVGVKRIQEIFSRYPSTRFILYGSYQEEAYMKRCMEYGVIETIFRPVKPAELGRALSAAEVYLQQMDQENNAQKSLINSYKENLYQFQYISLSSILNGHVRNEDEIQFTFKYFGFDFQSNFTVFLLQIDHFKKILLTLDDMEKHLLIYKIHHIIKDMLKTHQSESIITDFRSITTIMSGIYSLEEMIQLWNAVREEIHQKTKIGITIGMGRTYEKAPDICISYKEALAALRYRFIIGHNVVIPIHYVEPANTITYRYPLEREERLVYTAALGQYEYCHKLLNEIFDALRKCGSLPNMLLSKIVMDIIISINRYLSEQSIDLGSQFNTLFPSKNVLSLKDIDEAFSFLDQSLENFCRFILQYREDNDNQLYIAAQNYLSEKYFETFSLQKIAVHVGTTADYLNKVFMEREKKTVFEYTLGLRMNEAKKLMRETDFDDDTIAVKVGYEDGRYFRGVFKQNEGVNTNEYRSQYSLFNGGISTPRR